MSAAVDDVARTIRWRASADGKGGVLRFRWSRAAFHGFALVWNLVLPQVVSTDAKPVPTFFVAVGVLAAALFGYFFVRALLNTTTVRFEDGRFVCRMGPLPPRASFEHPLADIHGFVAEASPDGEEWSVVLVTRGAFRERVPIDVDGFVLVQRGSNKALFGRARREQVAFVAERLDEALDRARRESTQYRVAGALPAPPRVSSDEAPGSSAADGVASDSSHERARRSR